MNTSPIHIERRAAQRFEFHLPVSIRVMGSGTEGHGFTRDLSARGAFFYTEIELAEGSPVELTVMMPSEITLAENMRVRCVGKVTRVTRAESQLGVAVHIEKYEFLPESSEPPAAFERISALHKQSQQREIPQVADSSGVRLP